MIRYTPEQKAAALAKAKEIGISKASKELNISPATFYTWKKDSGEETKSTAQAPKANRKKAPQAKKTKASDADAIQTARQLLAEEDNLAAKVVELQSEVAALHEKNAKLKKALAALLD